MNSITKPSLREIIDDYAQDIREKKILSAPPTTTVIDFRDELINSKERTVYLVPLNYLRYRKYNGRISSDVLDYEKNHGILDEKNKGTQDSISGFLARKDKDKTKELRDSILLKGQQEPAIITCDGFLINGNRRKLVIEELSNAYKGDPRFERMKVVILPGKNVEGGPPTLLEIEQIENRYQLQSIGKAEYYGFDRALSIRRKIKIGMTLEEQLRDDPAYAHLSPKNFKKEFRKFEEEYLKPLECVDRYLDYLGRSGLYATVALGMGDPEGRWQAFIDYYKSVYKKITDEKERMKLGIDESEIGKIEDIAFKIIRKRKLKHLPKAHEIIRLFPKMLSKKESKKELLRLSNIELNLTEEESVDSNGTEYDERTKDKIWREKNEQEIQWHVKNAKDIWDGKKESGEPLDLLNSALNKMNHENMQTEKVASVDIPKARTLAFKIKKRADELESEFYQLEKKMKKNIVNLTKKYKCN